MELKKRSCFAEVMGTYFEVPDRAQWVFIDPVCRVYAVCSEVKPKPNEESTLPLWEYHGDATYLGMVRLFKFKDWRDMVFDVRGKLFTRDEYISIQIRQAIEYCADKVSNSDSMGAAYCAQVVRMVGEQLAQKKYVPDDNGSTNSQTSSQWIA